jgi:branched-chain amino acid transport system substrate-binding protein
MRYIFLTVGIIITLLAALACEPRGKGNNHPSDTGAIIVGYYGDLSGRTSNFGQSTRNGALMALDEINRAGGVGGRPLQLLVEDDQGRPEQAATVVTKFINQDKVHALLGEVASGNTLAAAPKAQAAHIPMITPSSTADSVTAVGDYIFRVCYTDSFQGQAMAKFAANTLKAKRAAILLDFNSPYSRGLTQVFKDNFTRAGGQVVTEQSYTQGDRDYKGQLTSIRASGAEVIFIPGYYGEVGVIAKQAKELGITQPLLGTDGWDAPQLFELGGTALNGSYMSNHYSVDDPSPAIQNFIKAYRARYNGATPDALAALGYDAMNVLADALRRAGTTDGPTLRDAIAHTSNFPGVTGTININAERNAIKPIVVLKLENGRYVYQETIQPPESAGKTAAL